MPRIETSIDIVATPEVCFDLARSVEAHMESTSHTDERAVAGVTSGLMTLGDSVTWRARHLGVTQHLTSRITAFDRPRHFRDEMTRGAFKRMVHDHFFEATPTGTRMIDVFDFDAPLGLLGRVAEWLFLTRYMRAFAETRNAALKRSAEAAATQSRKI